MTYKFLLLFAALCLISRSQSAVEKRAAEAKKDFPEVSDRYVANIEMYVTANKSTRSLYTIFDAPNNRAVIKERMATGKYKNLSLFGSDIYNFYTNQIVETIDLPDGSVYCNASELDGKGADTFMFGNYVNSTTGFTVASAFMINPYSLPEYKGKETLDTGVKVEKWLDKHYITALDADVVAEWYFTDEDDWTPSTGNNHQVPVMLKVRGEAYGTRRKIDHTYTFNNYKTFITKEEAAHFQIIQGTLCPHLKNFDVGPSQPHDLPPIAPNGHFSMASEMIHELKRGNKISTVIREYYDNTYNLVRLDYTPKGISLGSNLPGSQRPLTEVHDFVSGLVYVRDVELGNCTISPLHEIRQPDAVSLDSNHVRIKSVKELFGISGNSGLMNWTYTGQRTIRDVLADVYISERKGIIPGIPDNHSITWELAFAAPTYLDVTSSAVEVMEPIRIYIKLSDYGTIVHNIFEFDEGEPDPWTYDVGICHHDNQKSNVHFAIQGDQSDIMERNRKTFTSWLYTTLIGSLGVAPIRLSNLDWQKSDTDDSVRVSFQILDPSEIRGNNSDSLPTSYTLPTSRSLEALNAIIASGLFVVEIGWIDESKVPLKPVYAIPESIHHIRDTIITRYLNNTVVVTRNVTVENVKKVPVVKLEAGAAAGIAIAFLVAGVGLGVLIIFIINKVRGGSLPNLALNFKKFTNES